MNTLNTFALPRSPQVQIRCDLCRRKYASKHTCCPKSTEVTLGRIIAYVGGAVEVTFLNRLKLPKQIWDSGGNVHSAERFSELAPIYDHYETTIKSFEDSFSKGPRRLEMSQEKCNMIKAGATPSAYWKALALKAVAYAFPEHQYFAAIQ